MENRMITDQIGARPGYVIEPISNSLELRDLYRKVFQAHPWHEEMECGSCGATYAKADNMAECGCADKIEKLFPLHEGPCDNCGESLEETLRPMWEDNVVSKEIDHAGDRKGYCGVQFFNGVGLLGFAWGYELPSEDEPGKMYSEIIKRLETRGISREQCFYHSEIGVRPDRQEKGLGTFLFRQLMEQVEGGKEYVVYRTINEAMKRIYSKTFNEVKSLGKDPDDTKRQEWFYACLSDMRDLETGI